MILPTREGGLLSPVGAGEGLGEKSLLVARSNTHNFSLDTPVVDCFILNGVLDGECGEGGKCGEKKTPRNKNKSAQF